MSWILWAGERAIASLLVSDGVRALLVDGRLDNPHWESCEKAMLSVVSQLNETAVYERLLAAGEREEDSYWRNLF